MALKVRQIELFASADGGGVTSAGTFYSTSLSLPYQSTVGVHMEWDAVTATDTLWASDKPAPGLADDDDWVQVTSGVTIVSPTGSAAKTRYDIAGAAARWLRFKSVHGSGTGKRRGWATIKEG